jgi:hypothetical protein
MVRQEMCKSAVTYMLSKVSVNLLATGMQRFHDIMQHRKDQVSALHCLSHHQVLIVCSSSCACYDTAMTRAVSIELAEHCSNICLTQSLLTAHNHVLTALLLTHNSVR